MGFKWVDPKENSIEFWQKKILNCKENTGYILEVSIKYPKNLHSDHKDLLLAP